MAKIKRNKNGTRKDVIISKAAKLFREKGTRNFYARLPGRTCRRKLLVCTITSAPNRKYCREICFKVANEFTSHIEEVYTSKFIEKIEAIIRFHIRQMVDNYEEVYVNDREWKHPSDPYLSNIQTSAGLTAQRIAQIIEKRIRKDEIKSIDAPTAVINHAACRQR